MILFCRRMQPDAPALVACFLDRNPENIIEVTARVIAKDLNVSKMILVRLHRKVWPIFVFNR